MARVARRDGTGALHHVLMRGIERRAIFRDDVDRSDFVSRLKRQLIDSRACCLAWALMSNHVHLVLRTGSRSLSNVMLRLNGGYARAYNIRHQRTGYLFEDRFHSILVEEDAYLRVLVRYVHLNPLRAGVVESLEALGRYPWSGHAELMGHSETGLLAKNELLAFFGPNRAEAVSALETWMHAGRFLDHDRGYLPPEATRPATPPGEQPEQHAPLRWEPSGVPDATIAEIRARTLRASGWTLDTLIDWVCECFGADPVALRAGRRTGHESRARAVVGALATRDLGLPVHQVARATGVTQGPLCRAIGRGVRLAAEKGVRLSDGALPEKAIRQPRPR